MNQVTLIGRLGKDPKIEESNGTVFARFSLATNRRWKDAGGERQERTDWHQVVAFNGLARSLESRKSGDRVAVHGRLQSRAYEVDAERRTAYEMVAAEVEFL
jgi:single-strand DNA-binding protein